MYDSVLRSFSLISAVITKGGLNERAENHAQVISTVTSFRHIPRLNRPLHSFSRMGDLTGYRNILNLNILIEHAKIYVISSLASTLVLSDLHRPKQIDCRHANSGVPAASIMRTRQSEVAMLPTKACWLGSLATPSSMMMALRQRPLSERRQCGNRLSH